MDMPQDAQVQQSQQAPMQPQPQAQVSAGLSEDTKTIITILTLVLVYPVGLIFMFIWMKWKWWVKLLVTLPVTLFIIGIFASIVLVAINPTAQLEKARCATNCQGDPQIEICMNACLQKQPLRAY